MQFALCIIVLGLFLVSILLIARKSGDIKSLTIKMNWKDGFKLSMNFFEPNKGNVS